jgi:predicted ATP-grasp superfamily ATP-dependent carboligase
MRFLITSSRMPAAIDEIRKLGHQGHEITASDTISMAPGSHSKYATRHEVTASPRFDTAGFIGDVARIVREQRIDVVLPAFEEVFYLAKHAAELAPLAKLFFPPLETLMQLHDKGQTLKLASSLGVRVPRSMVVTSGEDLERAAADLGEYFARPVYSRGGVELLTNAGPLAGVLEPSQCEVTKEKPWLVQEFVHGQDVCTFSVAHHGRLSGHAAYIHPREIEHAGGIVFESVHEQECLSIAQKIVEATRYHGQLSFDFMRTDRGMVLIECNPRPTAGVHLVSPILLDEALRDEQASKLRIAEPGVQRKYSIALLRDMMLHVKEVPEDLKYLFSHAKEVFADPDDLLPALYQFLSYIHVIEYRLHHRGRSATSLMAAYFDEILWNGQPIS